MSEEWGAGANCYGLQKLLNVLMEEEWSDSASNFKRDNLFVDTVNLVTVHLDSNRNIVSSESLHFVVLVNTFYCLLYISMKYIQASAFQKRSNVLVAVGVCKLPRSLPAFVRLQELIEPQLTS